MESAACALLGLGFVIFVIVAVIHFIYSLFVGSGGRNEFLGGDCPHCAARISSGTICPKCGYHLGKQKIATLDDELRAIVRQMSRLAKDGRISDALRREVLDAVGADIAYRRAKVSAAEAAANLRAAGAAAESARKEAWETAVPPASRPVAPTENEVPGSALGGFSEEAKQSPGAPGCVEEPVDVLEVIDDAEPALVPTAAAAPAVAGVVRPSIEPSEAEPRGLAGVLQSFMEEKNIRWGELVSGLLIVVSSVGLVISLWATLKDWIPYFPVAVFLAVTAAMHGAGLYTLRRWRLKSTSRGLLLVSTLLVPLNVLAAMVLNANKTTYGPIDYGAVTLGLAALAGLVYSAARILNKRNAWPMFVAVTGSTVGMSLIGRLTVPGEAEWRTVLLFALPFASFFAAAIAHINRLSAGNRLTPRRAAQSFRFLGIGLFSLVLSAAFLAAKSGAILPTLSLLSPLVSLLAATLTAAGLVIQQRMSGSALAAEKIAGYRTTGTAIAIFGGVLVLAAVALAWPRPDLLVEVGLLNAIAFSALAFMAEMPELQLFATASFSLACLVGFHWSAGRVTVGSATTEGLADLLREARSGLILAILSLAADAAALLLRQTRFRRQAVGYSGSALLHAGAAAAIAVFAIVWKLPDDNLATAVFLVLALRWLVAAWWIRRPYATWIGAALLLAALGHGLAMNTYLAARLAERGWDPLDPWTLALIVHAVICTVYADCARIVMARRGAPTPFLGTFEKLVARVATHSRAEGLTPSDARGGPEGVSTAHVTSVETNAHERALVALADRGDQPLVVTHKSRSVLED